MPSVTGGKFISPKGLHFLCVFIAAIKQSHYPREAEQVMSTKIVLSPIINIDIFTLFVARLLVNPLTLNGEPINLIEMCHVSAANNKRGIYAFPNAFI